MPEIIATLDSPAAIGGLPGSGFAKPGLGHIPGSVLRGAVAAAWIAAGRPVDETFQDAFERNVHWGPLHLAGAGPTPMSWWQHKYEPGPTCPRAWDAATGVIPDPRVCPVCGDPIEQSKGAISGVQMASQTHVQLQDGTAAEGQLFMRRQIQAGQKFRGQVTALTESSEAALAEALSLVGLADGRQGTAWLGGRRSSDRGRATLSFAQGPRATVVQNANKVAFMLLSPGIFVDDSGAAAAQPRDDELSEVLGVPARVERRWSRWTTVGGWHAASRMPKPTERAAEIGSVYLVHTDSPTRLAALDLLTRRGLGLRRAEGFGAIAALPVLPRSAGELRRALAPLRVLQTSAKLTALLVSQLKQRSAQLSAGQQLAPMTMLEQLKQAPPKLVTGLGLTDGSALSGSATFLDSLRDPQELQVAIEVLEDKG